MAPKKNKTLVYETNEFRNQILSRIPNEIKSMDTRAEEVKPYKNFKKGEINNTHWAIGEIYDELRKQNPQTGEAALTIVDGKLKRINDSITYSEVKRKEEIKNSKKSKNSRKYLIPLIIGGIATGLGVGSLIYALKTNSILDEEKTLYGNLSRGFTKQIKTLKGEKSNLESNLEKCKQNKAGLIRIMSRSPTPEPKNNNEKPAINYNQGFVKPSKYLTSSVTATEVAMATIEATYTPENTNTSTMTATPEATPTSTPEPIATARPIMEEPEELVQNLPNKKENTISMGELMKQTENSRKKEESKAWEAIIKHRNKSHKIYEQKRKGRK